MAKTAKKQVARRKFRAGVDKQAKGQAAVGGFTQSEGTRRHRKIRQAVGR